MADTGANSISELGRTIALHLSELGYTIFSLSSSHQHPTSDHGPQSSSLSTANVRHVENRVIYDNLSQASDIAGVRMAQEERTITLHAMGCYCTYST